MSVRATLWVLSLAVGTCAIGHASTKQDVASQSQAARVAGRYGEALELAARVADPGRRSLLELQARYWAGDLGGALKAARAGLEHAPEHLDLLYYATALPLDLDVPDWAAEVLPRLARAVRAAPDLGDDVRASYLERCEGFAARLAEQQDRAAQRDSAYTLARATTLGLGGLILLCAIALLMLPPAATARSTTRLD